MKRGSGYASPAVQGQRLVYIHRVENDEVVECRRRERLVRVGRRKQARERDGRGWGEHDGVRRGRSLDEAD